MSLQSTATIPGWLQGEKIKDLLRAYGAVIGMILVVGAVGAIQPGFLNPANVQSVLAQSTILVIMSLGLTIAMLLRGVDLSFAQVADVTGLMAAALIVHGQPIWLAFVAPLVLGLLIGCFNAALMAYVGIPAIIGTLGTMFIIRSGELIYTHGAEPQILFTLPRRVTHDFLFLGQQSVGSGSGSDHPDGRDDYHRLDACEPHAVSLGRRERWEATSARRISPASTSALSSARVSSSAH